MPMTWEVDPSRVSVNCRTGSAGFAVQVENMILRMGARTEKTPSALLVGVLASPGPNVNAGYKNYVAKKEQDFRNELAKQKAGK